MKTPLYRRATYIAFIIIFLVVSPLIILYTMGYRYNFSKGRVQKTGILKITTIPKGAQIYLNGTIYEKSNTPAKIEYVLPGDYEIQIKKDGYFDWQKKLAVYENGTTFTEKIMLWKKSEVQNLATSSAISWLVSPDSNSIISSDSLGQIRLTDINSGLLGELTGGKTVVIAEIKKYDRLILDSFSPSGRYVLITADQDQQFDYFILDTLSKKSQKITNQNYISLKWDDISDHLYASDGKTLTEISLSDYKAKVILADLRIDDFFVSGRNLYAIAGQILNERSLAGGNSRDLKKIDCSSCRIKIVKAGKAFILDKNKNSLHIADLNSAGKNIELGAAKLDWLNNNSVAIYNDFEIYILKLSKDQPDLITRLGTPIKSVIWHPGGRHLLFSADNKIKIIELDNRELRNIVEVKEAGADFLALDRSGENLYYSLDKAGIFKLNIQ